MKTSKKPLKKSGQKAAKKAKPAAKKTARKAVAKKLGRTAKPKASEKEFPGYPKYPASEDIMNQDTRLEGNLDDEVLTGQSVNMNLAKDQSETMDTDMPDDRKDDLKPVAVNESDVTEEDLEALGPRDLSLSMDMGDDEALKHRAQPVDFTGKDLDIPGSELDDDNEELGSEDEENNSYSLGGDNHEDLEEPRA